MSNRKKTLRVNEQIAWYVRLNILRNSFAQNRTDASDYLYAVLNVSNSDSGTLDEKTNHFHV